MSSEEVLCGSPDALCLTSLSCPLPISPCLLRHLSSSSSSSSSAASGEQSRAGGLLQRGGPPAQHVKALSHTYTHIHGAPVSACLALHRTVISHQADQRTTAGSERTLTRRSPSGWQAIAHPPDREAHSPAPYGCFRSRPEIWQHCL